MGIWDAPPVGGAFPCGRHLAVSPGPIMKCEQLPATDILTLEALRKKVEPRSACGLTVLIDRFPSVRPR